MRINFDIPVINEIEELINKSRELIIELEKNMRAIRTKVNSLELEILNGADETAPKDDYKSNL